MSFVYVVTMPELGWDCVVGVFDSDKVSEDELLKEYPEDQYVIHDQSVRSEIN